ncbi:MAG: hypothetical protein LUE27_11465 [Clostridia bacterium]|nr:hypothetical protein [Clostridia bacterium]
MKVIYSLTLESKGLPTDVYFGMTGENKEEAEKSMAQNFIEEFKKHINGAKPTNISASVHFIDEQYMPTEIHSSDKWEVAK